MNLFEGINGVIFDLDGTLLNSMFIWENVGYDYLKSKKCNLLCSKKTLSEILSTMSLEQSADFFKQEYFIKDTTKKIINDINLIIENYYANLLLLKEGVFELLTMLKKQNIKMCIASATDKRLILMALDRLKISGFFCDIITCSEVGFGKDTPLIYNVAFKKICNDCKDLSHILVFEDALYAIKTATSFGYKVIGVYDDSSKTDQSQIKKLCFKYINSFKEIL